MAPMCPPASFPQDVGCKPTRPPDTSLRVINSCFISRANPAHSQTCQGEMGALAKRPFKSPGGGSAAG